MQTVGEILRAEREKKGVTIKDVESATNIRALYLSAIEDNQFSVAPGEVYLKGFIRNYANYLGLDGQEMVNLYRQQINPPPPPEPQTVPADDSPDQPEPTPTPTPTATQRSKKRENRADQSGGSSIGKPLLVAILLLLVVGAGWWFYFGSGNNVSPQQQSAQQFPAQPPPQQVQPPTVKPQQPQPQQAVPAQDAKKTKPVTVSIKISAECWASAIADGREIYEGILQAGDAQVWEAEQTLVVSLGNAAAAEITHNGRPVGKLGDAGEVVTRSFSR